MIISNHYSINFKGYREDVKLGERINKEVHQMGMASSSHTSRRCGYRYNEYINGRNIEKNSRLCDFLNNKTKQIHKKLDELRKGWRELVEKKVPQEEYVEKLIKESKLYRVGNCGEMSTIAQDLLKKEGVNSERILLNLYVKGTNKKPEAKGVVDHVFLVINMAENADFSDPKTWGEEAIIIDPWLGIAKRAQFALLQIKETMCFDPNKEEIKLERHNYVDVVEKVQKQKQRG